MTPVANDAALEPRRDSRDIHQALKTKQNSLGLFVFPKANRYPFIIILNGA